MSGFYIGKTIKSGRVSSEKFNMNALDLTTHIFICGSTGSGKTVLGKCLIEEAVKSGIPAVVIDLKGDLSSFKIPLYDLSENEISDFIEGYSAADQQERVKRNLAEFKSMLSSSGLEVKDVQNFRNMANIKIFTPKSRTYDQFSISFLTSPPVNFDELMKNEPETVLNNIANQAAVILKRLFGEDAVFSMNEEKTLMECAILHLYRTGADLEGKSGVVNLIKTIYDVPFERVGMLKVKEFISDERKMALIRRLNTLLVGAESLWYDGDSIDNIIASLVPVEKKSGDKTNLYIFNLSFLENFDDRNLVLSNIAITLFNRMKRLGDSREPRAVFYIDEIGGGKLSFFPDDPIQNESKSSINLLLRQGRAFGLGCVLATQNPGDIDYRGLTNCHTWFIGKLLTKADRDKVMQGIAATPYFLESYESFVKMAGSGDFIARTKDGSVTGFKERWLLTFHKVLTYNDLVGLKKMLYLSDDLLIGANLLAKKEYHAAMPYFQKTLEKDPDSQKAIGFLGECHFAVGNGKDALIYFERAVKIKANDYPGARSYYYMGEIALGGGLDDKALEFYHRSVKTDVEFADSYLRIAFILNKNLKCQEAMQAVQKYVVLRPHAHDGYYLMSVIYAALQDYVAAENAIKKANSGVTDRKLAYQYKFFEARINYYLARNAHSLELIDEAQKIAVDAGVKTSECDLLASLIFMRFKEYDKAAGCLESVIESSPSDEDAIERLAGLYYQTGKIELVNETLLRLERINASNLSIYCFKARLLIDQGEKQNALAIIEGVPQRGEGLDKLYAVKGLVYESLGRDEDAMAAYKSALTINPRSLDALYMISKNYYKNKEYEKQREVLLKLIDCEPEEKYYYELGFCYEKLNDYAKAIDAFNHLYLSVLSDPEINLKKSEWHCKVNNVQKAHESVDAFIKARPRSIDGHVLKGEIFTLEKKYEEALNAYERAEAISREEPKLWLARAYTYKEMGESLTAEDCENIARSFK